MKPVKNTQSKITPGMRIRLINGSQVPIGDRRSYDWVFPEVVAEIRNGVIKFKKYEDTDWYTVDMPWEILEEE